MPARECPELGLDDSERAVLTGFTFRAAQALAHLRDTWSVADADNAAAIETALKLLFAQSHSFRRNRDVFLRVLTHGFDPLQAQQFLARIGGAK
ncbi:MAG: hypothetical protein ACRD4T_00065 [Candidatus Acidiferrales bacterium]